jgi:hypothetical protein
MYDFVGTATTLWVEDRWPHQMGICMAQRLAAEPITASSSSLRPEFGATLFLSRTIVVPHSSFTAILSKRLSS